MGVVKAREPYREKEQKRLIFQPFLFMKGLSMSEEKLSLYNVDMKYNRELANHDDNVLSNSPQIGKENRPYIGIIVLINGKHYCAPITSPKPKHNSMPKNFDYVKIYDNDRLISVINFNNMIPVCKAVISKIDIQIHKNDNPQVKKNKTLLAKELDWCQKNLASIMKKAQKTYEAVISGNSRNHKLIKRSCDFQKLEKVLEKWIEKEFQRCNDVLNANPELKSKLDAAATEYNRKHNLTPLGNTATAEERCERRVKVLNENPELKSEYEKAEKEFDNKHVQQQSQTSGKPKHRR